MPERSFSNKMCRLTAKTAFLYRRLVLTSSNVKLYKSCSRYFPCSDLLNSKSISS